eukprot:5095886-Pyramimonas_sp.AAC.7
MHSKAAVCRSRRLVGARKELAGELNSRVTIRWFDKDFTVSSTVPGSSPIRWRRRLSWRVALTFGHILASRIICCPAG